MSRKQSNLETKTFWQSVLRYRLMTWA